jgi:hypothetical protein
MADLAMKHRKFAGEQLRHNSAKKISLGGRLGIRSTNERSPYPERIWPIRGTNALMLCVPLVDSTEPQKSTQNRYGISRRGSKKASHNH